MGVSVCVSVTSAGGLDASFALALRLDHAQASLHVALEELRCVAQERLYIGIGVHQLVLIQLGQTL